MDGEMDGESAESRESEELRESGESGVSLNMGTSPENSQSATPSAHEQGNRDAEDAGEATDTNP